jgi:hypothetical protein
MARSNKPDAVNPAMALWFAVEDQWRRVTDLERWAATMRPWTNNIILFVASLCLTGCLVKPWPGKELISPGVRGRVIDSTTQRPVEGAQAMIRDRPETAVQSDSTGTFYIPEVRQSYLIHVILFHEEWNIPRTREKCFYASISHSNYEGLTFNIFEQQREWPSRVHEPSVLRDVFLVPRRK